MNNNLLTGAALTIMAGLLLASGTTVMAGNGGTPLREFRRRLPDV